MRKNRVFQVLDKKQKAFLKECQNKLKKWREKRSLIKKGIRLLLKTLRKMRSTGRSIGKVKLSASGSNIYAAIESCNLEFTREDIKGFSRKRIILILDIKESVFNIMTGSGQLIGLMGVKGVKSKKLIEKTKLIYKQEEYIQCW